MLIMVILEIMKMIIRYITSDCDAVSIIYDDQRFAKSPEDAVVDVLKAGMVNVVGPFNVLLRSPFCSFTRLSRLKRPKLIYI